MSFAGIFRQYAGGARAELAAAKGLESVLRELIEGARAAWPGFSVEPEEFLRHLAGTLPVDVNTVDALKATFAADLYLALACRRGDGAALRAFEKQFLAQATNYLVYRHDIGGFLDELRQRLRTRLFVAGNGAQPKIGSYTGQGPLAIWLRTVATRMAINMRREEKWPTFKSDEGLQIRSPGIDPELDYLKTLYRGELEKAFRTTLAALSLNESNMLRLHFLEGMTIKAMCGVYRVSLRTMNRRITEARQRILDETRRLLAGRLRLSASQVDTLMGLALSQMHVSLKEFFEDPKTGK